MILDIVVLHHSLKGTWDSSDAQPPHIPEQIFHLVLLLNLNPIRAKLLAISVIHILSAQTTVQFTAILSK